MADNCVTEQKCVRGHKKVYGLKYVWEAIWQAGDKFVCELTICIRADKLLSEERILTRSI